MTQEPGRQNAREGWCVQFALPPPLEHCAGGGACWFPGDASAVAEGFVDVEARRRKTKEKAGCVGGGADEEMPDVGQAPKSTYKATAVGELPKARGWGDVYATGCQNKIRVYRANRGAAPTLLQVYEDENTVERKVERKVGKVVEREDEDESEEDSQRRDDREVEYVTERVTEQHYSLAWTFNATRTKEWWLVTAGKLGVVRVLNVSRCRLEKTLTGHGGSINHISTHPRDPALILTASRDESLRLWNLRTSSTVAVFCGLRGHRGEVLYADFHHSGSKFASCGIDNSVRIWEVAGDEKVKDAILKTHVAANRGVTDVAVYKDENNERVKSKVPMVQFPTCCYSNSVHTDYVDCVSWVCDLLISKSTNCRLILWEPQGDRESLAKPASEYRVLEEYMVYGAETFFIRFGIDSSRQIVACGNVSGVVYVFQIDDLPSRVHSTVWPHKAPGSRKPPTGSSSIVRQCAFNSDASILIASDGNSRVSQYDRAD